MTVQQIRIEMTNLLKNAFQKEELKAQLDAVSLDVDLIIGFVLQKNRTWILFNRNEEIGENDFLKIKENTKKRATGLPIAYITNSKEFFGLDFYVDENVLIPKPDTELLVEKAIELIEKYSSKVDSPLSIIDMCSGSGCVGISVLKAIIDEGKIKNAIQMTFADISEKALEVTKKNAEKILPKAIFEKIKFVKSNLFDFIDFSTNAQNDKNRHSECDNCHFGKSGEIFDFILTNPPYVPHDETMKLLQDGRSEPVLALDGDVDEKSEFCGTNDGLTLIKRLVPQAFEHLSENGILLMETGEYNAKETAKLFKDCGLKNIRIEKDMNEMLRNVIGEKIL